MPEITILLPCKDQNPIFFKDALLSVFNQISPSWKLILILENNTPAQINKIAQGYKNDPRFHIVVSNKGSFAGALNCGLNAAKTDYVSILLSDDKLSRRAVSILQEYIRKYPKVDFFYSSRRHIDSCGKPRGRIMPAYDKFSLDHFKTRGSPVKHLLCWRRKKSLLLGGFDEEISDHGCDDNDLPWRMAEAKCKFMAVKECLYYYRIHHAFSRLSVHISAQKQMDIIRRRFRKHGVSQEETEKYIHRAINGYIIKDKLDSYEKTNFPVIGIANYRRFSAGLLPGFMGNGVRKREFFAHNTYFLPSAGPDGLKAAKRMCGINDPNRLWEIILFAGPPQTDEFPETLFFDDNIIWHKRQYGMPGQIATANVAIKSPGVMYTNNHVSDIVQRISRLRQFKTRVEKLFAGWNIMLLNSILCFAVEQNIKTIYSPTAAFSIANTDPKRKVQPELFNRIYDREVLRLLDAKRSKEWWRINVNDNRNKLIKPEKCQNIHEWGKVICILHDIEQTLGTTGGGNTFLSAQISARALDTMLEIERKSGVKATYSVVGSIMPRLKYRIKQDGHCLAFHSYDHNPGEYQLERCRKIDYRIKGYRAPRSIITQELNDNNLCHHNFEWLASSKRSLGITYPVFKNRIVRIPIAIDDYPLQQKKLTYAQWKNEVIRLAKENDFVVIGTHDCYAAGWITGYEHLLAELKEIGNLRTLDRVAEDIRLTNAF